MARIAGVNIPDDKRVEVALTYVFGIGRNLSNSILRQANIDADTRVNKLTDVELNRIREIVDKLPIEGDLRRLIQQNVKRLQEIGSYRGMRHRLRLPSRGQRTRTNARTKRGKRITVGSGRVKLTKT